MNAFSTPYLAISSWNACARAAFRAGDPVGHGSSTGAATRCVSSAVSLRRRRPEPQLGARAVGAGAGDQVVVHLHDDLRALVQEHAGSRGQRVRRVAGHPGGDPRRLAEPVDRAGGVEVDRQVRAAEARPALAAVCRVQLRRRGRLRARGLVEDHVVDAAGALRPDQRRRDVGALRRASGRAGSSGSRRCPRRPRGASTPSAGRA